MVSVVTLVLVVKRDDSVFFIDCCELVSETCGVFIQMIDSEGIFR